MSYSADTYSSDTYDVGAAPVVKHGLPFSVFQWVRQPEKQEPSVTARPIEGLLVITILRRQKLAANLSIARLQRHFVKGLKAISRDVPLHVVKLFGINDALKKLEASTEGLKIKRVVFDLDGKNYGEKDKLIDKSKAWHEQQFADKAQRAYWAQAGYCYCDKFSHVHSIKDCGRKREARENE